MNQTKLLARRASLLSLFVFAAAVVCFAQAPPEVSKVEPPNWWAGHSINPVRVLLRGRNLSGARVEAVGASVQTGLVRANAAGTYLFVDVHIDRSAPPGMRRLRVTNGAGQTTEAPFEISAPLSRAGRFQGFTSDDVIYFIMPDRFADADPANNNPSKSPGLYDRSKPRYYHGGDFQGIIDRLPYLKELGVTALWFNPVYDNNDRLNDRETYPEVEGGEKRPITDYHGYGPVDFYGVEEHYGSMAKLKELVEKAHAAGIKVIQDQVANHTGPYHPWVKDPPTPTWFYGTEEKHLSNNWQKWTTMNPRATYQTQRRNLEGWFIDILPDLNQDDEEVRRYLIQNTLWWLGTIGFDAIRMDTLPHVPRHFWRDWTTAIEREYPTVNVLGELFDGDPALLSYFQRGRTGHDRIDTGIHTLYDFPLHYALRDAFAKGQEIRKIQTVLAHDFLYPNPDVLVPFVGVHDMLRFMNEPGATTDGLKLAQTLVMTTRGTPLLYYGDEIAMPGGGDPDNRRDFPGGFPGDARNAFDERGRTPAENNVFNHLKLLGRLRAQLEPLRRGKSFDLYDAEQQYAYARTTGTSSVIVVFNNDTKPATISFDVTGVGVSRDAKLAVHLGTASRGSVKDGMLQITLPARTATILTEK
ncbi:MAG TPA: alpha-amylase family glycosyl hydrolase [Pyrinomonadaceae bacterium]|jgi:glycosidase